jgi:hypothetical protein
VAQRLHGWRTYQPLSFWDNQPIFIQVVVEKIDLKSLFLPVCEQYAVPIVNCRGWSDLHSRVALMRRFQEHERKGRRCILHCYGDHDPVGLFIVERFRKLLEELEDAVGWSPRNLKIERIGLNSDFIEQHRLLWIDGLETSSGKDLADPRHRLHRAPFVQRYLAKYGARKVEANALIVASNAGRALCRQAIEKHLDKDAIATYERLLAERRQQVRLALPDAVEDVLGELREDEE